MTFLLMMQAECLCFQKARESWKSSRLENQLSQAKTIACDKRNFPQYLFCRHLDEITYADTSPLSNISDGEFLGYLTYGA